MNEIIKGINQRAKEYPQIIVNGLKVHEHKQIWEINNGKIPNGYVIHHLNGNKKDNRIENLECLSIKEHALKHRKKK